MEPAAGQHRTTPAPSQAATAQHTMIATQHTMTCTQAPSTQCHKPSMQTSMETPHEFSISSVSTRLSDLQLCWPSITSIVCRLYCTGAVFGGITLTKFSIMIFEKRCTFDLSIIFQGRNNMFHAILLFLHHIKTKECGMLG